MKKLTVKNLSDLAGVSVRTLHHYDEIGLLKPSIRSEKNYRYYSESELLKLQQILLYKEMGFPLNQIIGILDDPGFDFLNALEEHKKNLEHKKKKTEEILRTVERTIKNLKTNKMDHNDLYRGFSKEQALGYRKEAAERWGEKTIQESEERLLKMGKEKWNELKRLGDSITRGLSEKMHLEPADKEVQQLIKQHYEMTGQYFELTPEIYHNLGNMYVDDERFRSFYDKYKKDFSIFMRDAINVFVENGARI